MTPSWRIAGQVVISCNCDVFCPCVLSLGKARPTQGSCHSWFVFQLSAGHWGATRLDGLRVALLLEVPGPMEEGNWTVGLYLDERADPSAVAALTEIFTGRAGGPSGWWSMMISSDLGARQVPITFADDGRGWRVSIPKILEGSVEPLPGAGGDRLVRITNSRYWMAPDVVVCMGRKSRIRDSGRNWNFTGKSAEFARFDWSGP